MGEAAKQARGDDFGFTPGRTTLVQTTTSMIWRISFYFFLRQMQAYHVVTNLISDSHNFCTWLIFSMALQEERFRYWDEPTICQLYCSVQSNLWTVDKPDSSNVTPAFGRK